VPNYPKLFAAVRRIHPNARQAYEYEKPLVDAWLRTHASTARPLVLDAGCGFQYGLVMHYKETVTSVGLDPDVAVLRANRDVDIRVVGDDHRLPFADDSFDLLFCRDVIEHLRDPARAAREFGRVLKPGGLAIISTVNVENPGIWSIRLVPRSLRHGVRKASWGEQLAENAPTYHRANTPHKLRRALENAGLVVRDERHWPVFLWYFLFLPPALMALAVLNRAADDWGFSRYFGAFLVAAEKPQKTSR